MVFSHDLLQFLILYSFPPYPSNHSPHCQLRDGLQGSACLGAEKGEGQHTSPTGLLLDFVCPQQKVWFGEEPDKNFLVQG